MTVRTSSRVFAIRMLLVLIVFCSLCRFAPAQTTNGTFHGTVADASGAVVPDTTVEAKNLATNAVRQAVSNSVGFYTILQVPPGHYSISASKGGFSTSRQADVELLVNQDLEVNFTLQLGAVTQEIQVTAAPPALETASATVGQVIGSQQVVELPLNGRQFTELVLLTPGAAPKETGQQGFFVIPIGGGGISPSVNGQRGQQNNFTLDGALNNAVFTNTWAISPPPDAIQEFKVQSHIVDAQFSISSGANINVATKSGGNAFHGDVWEFIRNDKLDTANFFDNFANQKKPPFRQNQYGFAAGGPVIIPHLYDGRKANTYVFGYWEGFRSREAMTSFDNVPPPNQLGGDFSSLLRQTQVGTDCAGNPVFQGEIFDPSKTSPCPSGSGFFRQPFPGNQIPPDRINAAALTYMKAFFPVPNFGSGGFPNLAVPVSQAINSDQFGVKIDHSFGNNDTLYGGFYYTQPTQVVPSDQLIGTVDQTNHARGLSLGYTHVMNPTLLTTFHYGYTRTDFGFTTRPGGVDLLTSTHLDRILPVRNGIPLVPGVGISPAFGTSQFAIPLGPIRSHMVSGDVQKIRGSHTLSAGVMVYRIHSFDDGWGMSVSFDNFATASPGSLASKTGYGLASALLGLPGSLFGFLGSSEANTHGNWYGAYLQDKWQASKKLSLQFGLRYDFVEPMHWARDQVSGVAADGSFLVSQPFQPLFPFPTVRKTYFDPQYHGFQPRFGFAYSATPKTVIRGGFAMFDDHNNNLVQLTQDPRIKWPWAAGVTRAGLNQGVPDTFFENLPLASSFFNPLTPQVAFSADNRNKIPYAMEWNLGLQREIAPNITAEIDYIGSGSRHLFIQPGINQAVFPGPTTVISRVPFPQYGGPFPFSATWGTGNYQSLQVKVEKRYSQGLSFLSSYTWSHCFSIEDEGQAGSIENFYNREADYASCDFDFTHVYSLSSVYTLPFGKGKHFNLNGVADAMAGGWNVSGIWRLTSGQPFTVAISFDNANVGQSAETQRAQQVGDPRSGFTQSINEWYNTSAFRVPDPFTFGNVGRNTLRGPSNDYIDFSIFKDFRLTESKRFQFRTDFFNLPNHANFAPPGGSRTGSFSTVAGEVQDHIDSPTAGQIRSAAPGREIQFSLKFLW